MTAAEEAELRRVHQFTVFTVSSPMQHALGECGLHTRWAGDDYCILPPPPDKGFQIHIGPSSYDNPETQYLLAAGAEPTTDFNARSGNDKEAYIYVREYRMRPGGHHYVITGAFGNDELGQLRREKPLQPIRPID